ncbi:MAG: IPT/TIG domain-containing protein [Kofleriaceae bacterium]
MRRPVVPLLLLLGLVSCGDDDTTLRVTGLSRNTGDVHGGDYIVVRGNGFTNGARNVKVYFGTKQGTFIRFVNDDELVVEAPGGKVGEKVDLRLDFEPGGTIKIPDAFTFVEKNYEPPTVDHLDTSKPKK